MFIVTSLPIYHWYNVMKFMIDK